LLLLSRLVVHQMVRENPTAPARGPKLVVADGKTYTEDVTRLLNGIPTTPSYARALSGSWPAPSHLRS
jgi:hypothetical protein